MVEQEFGKERKNSTSANDKKNIPSPRALVENHKQGKMREFIKIFRQLQVNLPLCDLLLQVPKYARYLKDMLMKKGNFGKHQHTNLVKNVPPF